MASYYNGFPVTYQPIMPIQNTQPNPAPVQSGSLVWIQGEQAAKSYLVAPNSSVVLFDSESQSIYIKSADASGMPSMKILDYTIRDTANPVVSPVENNNTSYATKDEIKAVSDQITALRERVDGLTKKKVTENE